MTPTEIASRPVAQCLMVNCRNRAPADEAFCAKHRAPHLHRELQHRGGSLNMRSLAYITDLETREAELVELLRQSLEYVSDSLEAHEHSDGRPVHIAAIHEWEDDQ